MVKIKKDTFQKYFPYITLIIAVLVGFLALYFFFQYRALAGAQPGEKDEVKRLTESISKYMVLPDEEPSLATVTDIGKLKAQPFFTKAKNDDKVLIFPKAHKVLLYRPSENKIIEVGVLTVDQTAALPQPTPSPKPASPSATIIPRKPTSKTL